MFEPNAPSFEERFNALKIAKDHGFNTSISVEPLLDDDPEGLINKLSPYLSSIDYKFDIGTIWIGLLKINYIPLQLRVGKVKQMIDKIKKGQKFESVFSYYSRFYDNERVKWKESILKLMILNDMRVREFYY